MSTPRMSLADWILLVVLSLLWGASFFFAKVAITELRPFTVVAARLALGAAALMLAVRVANQPLPGSARTWAALAVMGALNNVIPMSLIVWAQLRIDSGLASILNATTPLFTVLLAHVAGHEQLTASRMVGVGLGVAGVSLLIGPAALGGLGADVLSQGAILGAAVSYACAGVWGRRLRSLSPLVAATGMVAASAVMVTALALLERPWAATPGPATRAAVLAIALPCTAVAYVIYFRLLASAGAVNLLLVTLLMPIVALLLGLLVLGERLAWPALAGMALVFVGLAAIDGRLLARARHSKDGTPCRSRTAASAASTNHAGNSTR